MPYALKLSLISLASKDSSFQSPSAHWLHDCVDLDSNLIKIYWLIPMLTIVLTIVTMALVPQRRALFFFNISVLLLFYCWHIYRRNLIRWEEEAKFKEIQWDYQRAGPSLLLLVLHNTRNKLHHSANKLVGTLEEYQCGDCYKFAEKIINSLWVAGESYK